MKTKADFEKMTVLELRGECKSNNIAGYGRMTKDQMIEKLSALSGTKITLEAKVEEKVFTDRHLIPLRKGQRVNARVGGARWFQGTVINFKEIEGEEYISVLLDGKTLSKLFHSADVEILIGSQKAVVKDVPQVEEEKPEHIITKPASTPMTTKSNSEVIKKISLPTEYGFRKSKYDDILAGYDIKGLRKGDKVSFKPFAKDEEDVVGELKSFIWDKQGNCPYFLIVAPNGKEFYKKIESVTKV